MDLAYARFYESSLTGSWCNLDLDPAQRLVRILSDKVLRFNPYAVEDAELLACSLRGRIQPLPAITQMYIINFHHIGKVYGSFPYDVIYYNIGNETEEKYISLASLLASPVHHCTKRMIRSMVNSCPITNRGIVERMQGESYFVSHMIPAEWRCKVRPALHFHHLKGKEKTKTQLIRELCASLKSRC